MLNSLKILLKKESVLNGVFFLFLAIILLHRILLFFTVNINCIDNDQVVMWSGAKDFSQGLFYVPRYYGQDYSTMMEGLFAAPLIKLNVPVYYAVPIATHFIFLTPFLFNAFYLFFKKKKELAIIVLGVLLSMPVGFDIMTSIPRGFVTGLFFSSLFVINFYNPKNYQYILINTFLAYVGYLVNQNSVLVSAPVMFYFFMLNYKDVKYYVYSVIGILLATPIDYGLNHFYVEHPNYILYGFNNDYSFSYFKDAISHLDNRFAHIGFFIEETCIILLIVFLFFGIVLYKKNKKLFFSYLVFICIIFLSFFSSKISDGIVWPFYSYSRMYIGMPLMICLMIIGLDTIAKKVIYLFIPIVLFFTVYKEVSFKKSLAYHVQDKMWGHVHLNTLKEIINALDTYKRMCNEWQVNDFIIINSTWHDDEINYAGSAVYDDYPNTFKPSFERRTWRILEETEAVHENFIVYTNNVDFDKYIHENYKDIGIVKLDDYGAFLIKNNKLKTVQFLKYIKAKTDGF